MIKLSECLFRQQETLLPTPYYYSRTTTTPELDELKYSLLYSTCKLLSRRHHKVLVSHRHVKRH